VLVLGYGGVGSALVHHLRRYDASVSVWDPDPVARARALLNGVRIGDRAELLTQAEVVIGVSGRRSLTAADLALLRDGATLVSGSSKQVEFGDPARSGARIAGTRLVTELHYPDRRLYLLNSGYPVNFLDQSVLGRVLDLVYAELYLCTQRLAERPWATGLWRLDRGLQHALADMWVSRYQDP
jgi:adenosylhomocysteinase